MKQQQLRKILILLAAVLTFGSAWAQTVTVKGTVLDQQNEPVIGATVLEEGTLNGTSTDLDGAFTLNVKSPKATLTVSYVGMETQKVSSTDAATSQ